MRRRPDIATNRAGIDESRGLTFRLPLFCAPALIAPIRRSLARRCDQSSLRSASNMHLTMSGRVPTRGPAVGPVGAMRNSDVMIWPAMTDDNPSTAPSADPADARTADARSADGGSSLIELMAAILLGVAGVLTAYAAFNGALAGGDALKGYTASSRTTADANGEYSDYSQTFSSDQAVFLQYQILVEQGLDDTAAVVKSDIMSVELEVATDAWLALPEGEGPINPLATDEYVIASFDNANALFEQADQEFADAQRIDDQGDKFDLASVFLAVSLFFAGIAALFKVRRIRIAMLGASGMLIVPGLLAIGQGKGWI